MNSFQAIIQLDGISYNIGGFLANTTRGYLNRTDLNLKMMPDPDSFQVTNACIFVFGAF
jgi:hypothetical protein